MLFDKDTTSKSAIKQKEERLKYEQRRDNPKPKRDKIRNKREHSESDSEDNSRRPRKKGEVKKDPSYINLGPLPSPLRNVVPQV